MVVFLMRRLRDALGRILRRKSEDGETRGVIEEIDLCIDHMINDGPIGFPALRDSNSTDLTTHDDEQSRVAETLNKLRRGDLDIAAYEDEHKFDGDGDDPA